MRFWGKFGLGPCERGAEGAQIEHACATESIGNLNCDTYPSGSSETCGFSKLKIILGNNSSAGAIFLCDMRYKLRYDMLVFHKNIAKMGFFLGWRVQDGL